MEEFKEINIHELEFHVGKEITIILIDTNSYTGILEEIDEEELILKSNNNNKGIMLGFQLAVIYKALGKEETK